MNTSVMLLTISTGTKSQKDIPRKRINTDTFSENFSQIQGVTPGYKVLSRPDNTDPEQKQEWTGR